MNDSVKTLSVVVVPLFNESEVIRPVLAELCQHFDRVIVVDDCSSDDSYQITNSFNVIRARHSQNLGQGAAIQTGIDIALEISNWNVLLTYDADGQHQVEDAVKIAAVLLERPEIDVCLGTRFGITASNVPRLKRLVLKVATSLTNKITGVRLTDTHNGLRALRREAVARIKLSHYRMAHATEFISLVHQLQLRYIEMPVQIRYTSYSIAKGQRLSNGFSILLDLLRRN